MVAWIFTLLVALAPPDRLAALPAFPGWVETAEQRTARYHAIAEDIGAVALSPSDGAALVALAFLESGFAPDVDAGRCYRGRGDDSTRCDSGQAFSLWQIHAGMTIGAHVVASEELRGRRRAAEIALLMVRHSRAWGPRCGGPEHALDVYASGGCAKAGSAAYRAGKARLDLARRLLREHPHPASE